MLGFAPSRPVGGISLNANFITYHSYFDHAPTFVYYQQRALDPSDQYSFRNPNYRTGQSPYTNTTYGITEWGCERGQVGQGAINFLNYVWHDPAFQGLWNSNLRSAYWYCDFFHVAGAKGIFRKGNDYDGDCALTSLANPGSCPNEPPAVCGEAFALL